MTCRVLPIPGGVAVACDRTERVPCSVRGCRRTSVALCDYPLSGSKAGKTCDRALCRCCRRAQGPKRDFCPPHHDLAGKGAP